MEEFLGTQSAVIGEDVPVTYGSDVSEGNSEERSSENMTASSENSSDTVLSEDNKDAVPSENSDDTASSESSDNVPAAPVKAGRWRNTTKYTLEEKKALVERARREGKSKVAKEAGIVVQTLYNWETALMKQSKEAKQPKQPQEPKQLKQPEEPQPLAVIKSVPEQKKEKPVTQPTKTDIEVENVILRAEVARLTKELTNFKRAITSLVSEF